SPAGVLLITEETNLSVASKAVSEAVGASQISYEDIGGLRNEIETIREMIEVPMKYPEVFKKLGISPPKGILLYGPPGTGKTLLAKAVAGETESHFIHLAGPEIMSKWYGQSEENLRNVFKEAQDNAPAIIFIDEVDAIAPAREEVHGEVEKRVVSQLLTLMDGLEARGEVVVIAATNRPEAIDPALRRPGRFDRELQIGVPDRVGRKEILQIHTRGMPLTKDVDLDKIADITYGYSGADISALTKEAAMRALRGIMPELKKAKEGISKDLLDKMKVTASDFHDAMKKVEPSSMREVLVEIPRIKWGDIGGLGNVKDELKETVEWPLKYSDVFKKVGVGSPKGILLYGPPGTGKTLLAKAVANESDANFISVKGPELLNKFVGESERGVRKVFKRARQVAPSIIFFDEIESLTGTRGMQFDSGVKESVVAQLLSEIDGVSELKDVVLIGATNRPDLIDPALLRPGRFEKLIYVPMPDKEARLSIFKVHTKDMRLEKDVDLGRLAAKTEGYSGADIEAVCRKAGILVVKEIIGKSKKDGSVNMNNFEEALKRVGPSVNLEDLERWGKKKEGPKTDVSVA
ncbi:MAG: CDC48 family AAA ATPase, partial [Candidatus Altiarchaeota archaeon]|nr:CDC48 family AAA ATPase [Candidatus Altiarchaeota archaeon]